MRGGEGTLVGYPDRLIGSVAPMGYIAGLIRTRQNPRRSRCRPPKIWETPWGGVFRTQTQVAEVPGGTAHPSQRCKHAPFSLEGGPAATPAPRARGHIG